MSKRAALLLLALVACDDREVPPGEIEVTASLSKPVASLARDTIGLTLEVRARNPLNEAVRVRVQERPGTPDVAMTGDNAAESYGVVFGARSAGTEGRRIGAARSLYGEPGERLELSLIPGSVSATTASEAGERSRAVHFAPGETKARRFVLALDTVGTYVLVGSFVTREARPVILRVTP